MERRHHRIPAFVGIWKLLLRPPGNRAQLRPRMRDGHAWLQSRDDAVVVRAAAPVATVVAVRIEQLNARRKLTFSRQHADDRDGSLIDPGQRDLSPDHSGIPAEPPLPQAVADDHAERVFAVVFTNKVAPEHRLHAEHLEEIGRDINTLDSFRLASAQQIERISSPRSDLFDALRLFANIENVARVEKSLAHAE